MVPGREGNKNVNNTMIPVSNKTCKLALLLRYMQSRVTTEVPRWLSHSQKRHEEV